MGILLEKAVAERFLDVSIRKEASTPSTWVCTSRTSSSNHRPRSDVGANQAIGAKSKTVDGRESCCCEQ